MNVFPYLLPDSDGNCRYDCATCGDPSAMGYVAENVRQSMHCGYLPEESWTPGREGLPPAIGHEPYTLDVCPGWLMRQPAVIEAAQGRAALKHGVLTVFHPDPPAVFLEAVRAMDSAFNHQHALKFREEARERERSPR